MAPVPAPRCRRRRPKPRRARRTTETRAPTPMTADPGEPTGQEQSFLSHLVELRSRLLRALAAVVVVFVVLVPFANRIYTLLAAPLLARLPKGASMVAIDVITPFFTP